MNVCVLFFYDHYGFGLSRWMYRKMHQFLGPNAVKCIFNILDRHHNTIRSQSVTGPGR